MKPKFKGSIVFSLVFMLLLFPNISYAHAMFLKLVEPGVLQVEYDGGGFSPRTEVVIFDKDDNELAKGLVDEEGKYHFDKSLNVHKAVAEDGMGHRAEYKEGVEETTIPKLPVIISVFAVIAVIFVIFNKKARNKAQ